MYNVKTENKGDILVSTDEELCVMLDINDGILAEIKEEISTDGESLLIHRFYEECYIEAAA